MAAKKKSTSVAGWGVTTGPTVGYFNNTTAEMRCYCHGSQRHEGSRNINVEDSCQEPKIIGVFQSINTEYHNILRVQLFSHSQRFVPGFMTTSAFLCSLLAQVSLRASDMAPALRVVTLIRTNTTTKVLILWNQNGGGIRTCR